MHRLEKLTNVFAFLWHRFVLSFVSQTGTNSMFQSGAFLWRVRHRMSQKDGADVFDRSRIACQEAGLSIAQGALRSCSLRRSSAPAIPAQRPSALSCRGAPVSDVCFLLPSPVYQAVDNQDGFVRRVKGLPTKKRQRNIVFIICGAITVVAMGSFAVAWLVDRELNPYEALIVEWICLWAFGIAWLVCPASWVAGS
jgi:hypothetical protein